MKQFIRGFLLVLFVCFCKNIKAQGDYEALHGVSGYDYFIKGLLELNCSHTLDAKDKSKQEGTYEVKSPVILRFNLNDLKFFRAQPKEFVGYVENQYDAYSGYVSGLFQIRQGGYQEDENWMQLSVQFKSWENEIISTIDAKGEIYPVLQVFFSIPDFAEKINSGLDGMQFRLNISGINDSQFHPQRNVTGKAKYGPMELTEGFDLVFSVASGTFYGLDLTNALLASNLLEARGPKRESFEKRFEQDYFKNLPRIDAMKLINFLIKQEGDYETPVVGSFSSDSESGSEKTTYRGTLWLYGNKVRKAG